MFSKKEKISPGIQKLKWLHTLFHTCRLTFSEDGKVCFPEVLIRARCEGFLKTVAEKHPKEGSELQVILVSLEVRPQPCSSFCCCFFSLITAGSDRVRTSRVCGFVSG